MSGDFLIRHAEELWERSEYGVEATPFLSPAKQREIYDEIPAARRNLVFWGGTLTAERRRAFFFPDWLADITRAADPTLCTDLAALSAFSAEREIFASALARDPDFCGKTVAGIRIDASGFSSLTHRDYLGAIMNLGLERETVGDIFTEEKSAYVFCTPKAAEIIKADLKKIGRDGVRVSDFGKENISVKRRFAEIDAIVPSLRFDCIVKPATGESARKFAKTDPCGNG